MLRAVVHAQSSLSCVDLDGYVEFGHACADFNGYTGDGDKDCIVGGSGPPVQFFNNTGTASNPVFTEQTGGSNPFANFNQSILGCAEDPTDIYNYCVVKDPTDLSDDTTWYGISPECVDIDGDGEKLL